MENKAKCSKGAVFIRVLDRDFSRQLSMPPSFTKYFDGEIPNWLIVEISGSRKCWRVDVENDDTGALYFTIGWDEFAEQNTLQVGNILLLEYIKPFILEVTIFDKDGSPKSVSKTSEFEFCKTKDSEHHHITHEEEEESKFGTRINSSLLGDVDGFAKPLGQPPGFDFNEEDSERRYQPSSSPHVEDSCGPPAWIDSAHEKQEQVDGEVERKGDIVSIGENGVAFSITWRNTMHLYYYLTIPREIAIKTNMSSQEEVVLKDHEGNNWAIELRTRPDGCVDLTQGWKEFLNKIKIKIGDVLTLRFCSDNLIQVNIECPSHNGNHWIDKPHGYLEMESERVEPSVHCDWINQTIDASQNSERIYSKFRKSSFSIVWKETTTHRKCLNIPKNIGTEQNLGNHQRIVLQDEDGKHWHTEIRFRKSHGRFLLARGWPTFWKRHGVVVGDTLNFEFISVGMVKVSITRGSQSRDISVGVRKCVDVKKETVFIH